MFKESLGNGLTAYQSSTVSGHGPALAVDSNPATCSITMTTTESQWWVLDLGRPYWVDTVTINISFEGKHFN